jgi:hypothetical protein
MLDCSAVGVADWLSVGWTNDNVLGSEDALVLGLRYCFRTGQKEVIQLWGNEGSTKGKTLEILNGVLLGLASSWKLGTLDCFVFGLDGELAVGLALCSTAGLALVLAEFWILGMLDVVELDDREGSCEHSWLGTIDIESVGTNEYSPLGVSGCKEIEFIAVTGGILVGTADSLGLSLGDAMLLALGCIIGTAVGLVAFCPLGLDDIFILGSLESFWVAASVEVSMLGLVDASWLLGFLESMRDGSEVYLELGLWEGLST